MKKELNKRFEQIIINCQKQRKKYGVYYEEKRKTQIEKYAKEIIENDLVNKNDDVHFAKQLCMMNCLKYE